MAIKTKSSNNNTLSYLDILKMDGNFKTKSSTFVIPSGTALGANGFMFTGSSGIRFDEYPFQVGYLVEFEVVANKQCTIQNTITQLLSANIERIHRAHTSYSVTQAYAPWIRRHNNFVTPGTVLACYLRGTSSATGLGAAAVTNEDITVTVNYSWIELPNNPKQSDIDGIYLVIGDSISYGYGVSRAFDLPYAQWCAGLFKSFMDKNRNIKMVNRAIAGSTAENIALLANNGYLNVSEPAKVKVITIMLGTNPTPDLATYQLAMKDIITRCSELFPNAKIILVGSPKYTPATGNYEARLETYRNWLQTYTGTLNAQEPKTKYYYLNMGAAVTWDDAQYGLSTTEVHPNTLGNQMMGAYAVNFCNNNSIQV